MTDTAAATIKRHNSHEVVATVKRRSGVDGKPIDGEGLTVTAWLSATEDGDPIGSVTPITLDARTSPSYDHEYAGLIAKADVNTQTDNRSEVYEVVSIAGELTSRLLTVVGPSAP